MYSTVKKGNPGGRNLSKALFILLHITDYITCTWFTQHVIGQLGIDENFIVKWTWFQNPDFPIQQANLRIKANIQAKYPVARLKYRNGVYYKWIVLCVYYALWIDRKKARKSQLILVARSKLDPLMRLHERWEFKTWIRKSEKKSLSFLFFKISISRWTWSLFFLIGYSW